MSQDLSGPRKSRPQQPISLGRSPQVLAFGRTESRGRFTTPYPTRRLNYPPMPLTDTAIRNAKPTPKAVKMFDAGGLFLLVQPTGSKLWRLKYRFGGKEKLLALGSYPEVGLRDARTRRDPAREQLANDEDPGQLNPAHRMTPRQQHQSRLGRLPARGNRPAHAPALLGRRAPRNADCWRPFRAVRRWSCKPCVDGIALRRVRGHS